MKNVSSLSEPANAPLVKAAVNANNRKMLC